MAKRTNDKQTINVIYEDIGGVYRIENNVPIVQKNSKKKNKRDKWDENIEDRDK